MKLPRQYYLSKILLCELLALSFIIAMIWLDEIFDVPHNFFGAIATPKNWIESLFESIVIILLTFPLVYYTKSIISRIKHLEGILSVCSNCKKMKDENNEWKSMEEYILTKSDAEISHGLCPECAKKLYPDIYK